jgi:cytochrome c peroxidase
MKKNSWIPVVCSVLYAAHLMAGNPVPADPLADSDFQHDGAPLLTKVELGQKLFFDKILSGNLNISCATCHHALTGSGDGLSLPVGEGGRGLGVTRDTGAGAEAIVERVPRNAPPLFNLGAREYVRMFHDGRVEVNPFAPSGFDSPAEDALPEGLENVLAAQAMFPVTSSAEMAGQTGENDVADAAAAGKLAGPGGVWELLAKRLQGIPDYVALFIDAFPGEILAAGDISYVHAANAISAFEGHAFRFDNSPFDQYLRGERTALSTEARLGMFLFYGPAGCADCHSGALQTDHQFHAIAMPQIGPGKGDSLLGYVDGRDDFGRERVTDDPADRFRFRTPSLRNIALTAPFGHAGAFDSLEAVVRHHLDSVGSLNSYDPGQATLPSRADLDALDFVVMNDESRRGAIADANQLAPLALSEKELRSLLAFLQALTDPAALDLRATVPSGVPSGLPLAE